MKNTFLQILVATIIVGCTFAAATLGLMTEKQPTEQVSQPKVKQRRFIKLEDTTIDLLSKYAGASIYIDTETNIKYLIVYTEHSLSMTRLWEKENK